MMDDERTIVIRDERAPSWNGMYAGMHWSKRRRLAAGIHWKVREALDPEWLPFNTTVDIYVLAEYREDPVDSDNVVAKAYIDGLKDRVIHDDNATWVRQVITEARLGSEDSVTIVVTPVEEAGS